MLKIARNSEGFFVRLINYSSEVNSKTFYQNQLNLKGITISFLGKIEVNSIQFFNENGNLVVLE